MLNLNKKKVEEVGGKVFEGLFPKDKLLPKHQWEIQLKLSESIDLKENIIPTESIVTNDKNLPDLLYRRLALNDYHDPTGAFITGSGLTLNSKQFFLKNKYKNAQISDANEMVASMLGTAVHSHMEPIKNEQELVELRLTVTIDGKLLSAQFDHFNFKNGIVSDYKITKAWSKRHRKEELNAGDYDYDAYVVQQNFIAYLLRRQGYEVNGIRLIFIYKDYDKYTYKKDYPLAQSEEEWLPLWSTEKMQKMLELKIMELSNIDEKQIQLKICSDKQMWRDPTTYSIAKVGSGRSLPRTSCDDIDLIEKRLQNRLKKYPRDKVVPFSWYDYTEKEKIKYAESYKSHLYIKVTQDIPKFCMDYCPGRLYCMQHQEWFLHNKKYKVKVRQGETEKIIEMYGSSQNDAIQKARMIHPNCIVEHPKANQKGISKYFAKI